MQRISYLLFLVLWLPLTYAQVLTTTSTDLAKKIEFKGWGFSRYENKDNSDFNRIRTDRMEFIQTRINSSLKIEIEPSYGYALLAPQFSKVWGLDEYTGSAGNTTTLNATSGGSFDSRMDVHEAYFALMPLKKDVLTFFVGRQEIAYGDDFILGSVPWHRVGRSFDAVRARGKILDKVTVDVFTAKLQDELLTAASTGDYDLHGLYATSSWGKFLKEADVYTLNWANHRGTSHDDIWSFGTRLKSPVDDTGFDYRLEAITQNGRMINNERKKGEYAYDLEIGYKRMNWWNSRLAGEIFRSSMNYEQHFPTAHKWLGYADMLARRNISGYVARFSTRPVDKVTVLLDYHFFYRSQDTGPAYSFAGASYGNLGQGSDVGEEVDLTVNYALAANIILSGGYSIFDPGKYFYEQNELQVHKTQWSFLQLLARY